MKLKKKTEFSIIVVSLNTKTYAVDVLSDIKKVEKILKKNVKKT